MQYLHVHSMYSKGDSTVRPESVVQKIQELGGRSVTLTDHGTLMGIDPFMAAGKKYGINTIPGVEVYGENRTHLILVPKNYKGFQAISYAMRDANEHIEKVRNLTYPIMLDSILTEYFQDNTDVIATSACIQGPISYILLANHRIKSKAAKAQNLYDSTLPAYERYTEAAQTVKDLKNEISSLKKQRTADSKPLKPAFQNKVVKLEAAVNDLEPGSKRHLKAISDLEFARKSIQMAEKLVQMEDQAISEKESLLSEAKEIVKATKAEASKHVKAKKELEERYASLKTEEELYGEAKEHLLWLRSVFPNFYIEVQYHGIEREAYVMPILYKLARETDTPLIAANDAHILDSSENSIEARRIIRFNYFKRAEVVSPSDHELYLKTAEELVAMLSLVLPADAVSEAIRNTEVLNDCRVIFPEETHYPVVQSAESFDQLLEEAREKMILSGQWNQTYEERLRHEISVIKQMGYVDYHMVVRDFCAVGQKFGLVPREQRNLIPEDYDKALRWIEESKFDTGVGIGMGRGSAAGSLVCYLLGITGLDPIRYDLLFERFLNPERVSMPDIDTDIGTSLRGAMIRYLKWRYGERAVCSIATVGSYAAKDALRLAGRDLASQRFGKLSATEATEKSRALQKETSYLLSDMIPETPGIKLSDCEEELKSVIDATPDRRLVWEHAKLVEGCVSSYGVHAGGVVISDNRNVNDYVPLAWNNEKQVWVAQCDMVQLEEKGLLKFDLLGVTYLDCVSDCLQLIKRNHQISIDVRNIPFEDVIFQEVFAKGNTNNVFQFESNGMKSMLKQFKPTCFEDIILLAAAYRPGPMQYLDGIIEVKNGRQPMKFKTPELQPILSQTYGAVIYQEQVMRIFQKLAGYSLGGADLVRRAMSKKKMDKLAHERKAFVFGDPERSIDGCVNRGINETVANELFDEMMEFAKYAFNKSHAAVYALLSYQTAYLKYHYPTEWLCATFNNRDQDKYEPIISDCSLYGVRLLPPDINRSYFLFSTEEKNIRYGISGIKGIGEANSALIHRISENRKDGDYCSVQDFLKRNLQMNSQTITTIPTSVFKIFANAGLFDGMGYNREKLSEILDRDIMADYSAPTIPNVQDTVQYLNHKIDELKVEEILPDKGYNLDHDLQYLGIVLSGNPLDEFGNEEQYGCLPISDLSGGERNISIMGFVASVEQRTTKNGKPMIVLELKGKTGNCTVLLMENAYFQYSNGIDQYLHKVITVTGDSSQEGTLFCRSLGTTQTGNWVAELRDIADTNEFTKFSHTFKKCNHQSAAEPGYKKIRIVFHINKEGKRFERLRQVYFLIPNEAYKELRRYEGSRPGAPIFSWTIN